MQVRSITMLANPARDQAADSFRQAVRECGVVVDEVTAPDPDAIGDVVAAALESGADVIAAVGGDGTQRTVGVALAGTSASLAVVPGGTVNLLAQVVGVPDIQVAARAATGEKRRAFDVGSCNDDRFLLNASSGYDADVIKRADDGNKQRWGRLSFVAAAASALRAARPIHVTVIADGNKVFAGRALSVVVTNVAVRSSGDFVVAPEATPDDGRLDVMVVRAKNARSLLGVFAALARGREPDRRHLLRAQAAEVSVRWSKPVTAQVDGDVAPTSQQFDVTVDPGALSICVPTRAES